MFHSAAPMFQEALKKSGYEYTLKFNPKEQEKSTKKRKRNKRKVTWFNPPYNIAVKTNIGKEFLKLVDECFPPGNPLSKIINRQTVKIGYSTTPNMAKIISGRNKKLLNAEEAPSKLCNCPKTKEKCPLNGKCLEKNIVYHAKVSQSDNKVTNYVGMTSTDFKARLGTHTQTFKDQEVSQTSLSKHIHFLKEKNIDFEITWSIIDRGRPFTPVSNVCNLCDSEKFNILFHPELSDLNSKSEFYSHCRHIKSKLLVKTQKKRPWMNIGPLGIFHDIILCSIFICLFSYSSKPEESRSLLETLSSLIKE